VLAKVLEGGSTVEVHPLATQRADLDRFRGRGCDHARPSVAACCRDLEAEEDDGHAAEGGWGVAGFALGQAEFAALRGA
jgi:hypothetical protein